MDNIRWAKGLAERRNMQQVPRRKSRPRIACPQCGGEAHCNDKSLMIRHCTCNECRAEFSVIVRRWKVIHEYGLSRIGGF